MARLLACATVLVGCAACSSDPGVSPGASPGTASSAGRSSSGPAPTTAPPASPSASRRVAASTGTPTRAPLATPTPRSRPHPRPPLGSWQVGARPLPLRPDGFGQVLPTPRVLRDRRLPTRDVLPPPADGRFHASVDPVSPAVRRRMGETWSPACPVGLDDLRYLRLTFRGFDGRAHTGELVVAASVADDVVGVFRRLFEASYPIEEMRLPTTADVEAAPTGDGNNTAAYVCRNTRGSTSVSAHAYGLAIDVNPFLNPYRRVEPTSAGGDLVLPELASAYLDRSWRRPGMIRRGGVVTRAFAAIGWTWGGDFHSVSDLMHFSATGR